MNFIYAWLAFNAMLAAFMLTLGLLEKWRDWRWERLNDKRASLLMELALLKGGKAAFPHEPYWIRMPLPNEWDRHLALFDFTDMTRTNQN